MKALNYISFSILASAVVIMATIFTWLFYPYNPLVINKRPLPIVERQVKQGGMLYFELDYCKYTDKPVTVSRRFIDGIVYSAPTITADNKEGCRIQIIGTEIPQSLPTGQYILSIIYSYQMNPIRVVDVTTHTEKFEVIE